MAFQFLSTGHWIMWNILFRKEAGSFLFSCYLLLWWVSVLCPSSTLLACYSFSSWGAPPHALPAPTVSLLVPLLRFSPTPTVRPVSLCPAPTFRPSVPRVPASSFILSSFLASYSHTRFLSLPPVGHSLSCRGTFLLIFLDHFACRYKPALISCLPSQAFIFPFSL